MIPVIGILSFALFIVFLVVAAISARKKDGSSKKWLSMAGVCLIVVVVMLSVDDPEARKVSETTTQPPSTIPATTAPLTTVPATTAPLATVPATTAPHTTVPVTIPPTIAEDTEIVPPRDQIDQYAPSEIFNDYTNNQLAAERKYEDKWIEIKGLVFKVDKGITGEFYLLLDSGVPLLVMGINTGGNHQIQAYFDDDEQLDILSTLNPGDEVRIIGKGKTKMLHIFSIYHCFFVWD